MPTNTLETRPLEDVSVATPPDSSSISTASEPIQQRPSSAPRVALILGGVFVATLLIIGGFVTWAIGGIVDAIPTPSDVAAVFEPEPFVEVGPVVVSSIQDLAGLTTVEVVEYAIVEQGTDEGWLAWARGDSLRMIAVARIGAGVDIAGISAQDFSVSDDGVVHVTVPSAEIQYVAVDNDATEVLDRDKGLFTKGDPQLEGEARRVAESVLVEGALENGILTQAEENARVVLSNFLIGLGYTDVVVEFTG